MGLLDLIFARRNNTAAVAKERLQIVLAHERKQRDGLDFLPIMQKELLEVVAKYVEISEEMIKVNVGSAGETSVLEINIDLDQAKVRPRDLSGMPVGLPAKKPELKEPPKASAAPA